jgi:hypothetical protein
MTRSRQTRASILVVLAQQTLEKLESLTFIVQWYYIHLNMENQSDKIHHLAAAGK